MPRIIPPPPNGKFVAERVIHVDSPEVREKYLKMLDEDRTANVTAINALTARIREIDAERHEAVRNLAAVRAEVVALRSAPTKADAIRLSAERPDSFRLEHERLRASVERMREEMKASYAKISELTTQAARSHALFEAASKSLAEARSEVTSLRERRVKVEPAEGLERELQAARGHVARLSEEKAKLIVELARLEHASAQPVVQAQAVAEPTVIEKVILVTNWRVTAAIASGASLLAFLVGKAL